MQRLAVRLVIALLTFLIGVSAQTVWASRQRIADACVQLLSNYQD